MGRVRTKGWWCELRPGEERSTPAIVRLAVRVPLLVNPGLAMSLDNLVDLEMRWLPQIVHSRVLGWGHKTLSLRTPSMRTRSCSSGSYGMRESSDFARVYTH